ncbi:MAG: NADH-quinone oxidoreductase subunit L [Acidobacteriota bacterium]
MLSLLWLIPVLPLAGFVVNGLFGKRWLGRRVVAFIGCGTVLAAFILSLGVVWQLNQPETLAFIQAQHRPGVEVDLKQQRYEVSLWTWIHAGKGTTSRGETFNLDLVWGFQVDPLSSVLLLVVTGVGFLIHLYSIGYMAHEGGFERFFTYLNLFMAMMLVLVLGANFLVLFVGWEGVGLCSYLLIGFFYDRPFDERSGLTCADAGRKAFIVNRIGDLGFMLGALLILTTFGSLDFSTVSDMAMIQGATLPAGLFTAMGLLLFLGATGKSAQIPLYVWLPDAMAGPTPVSALIHAATMVTAGVYMVCRTSAIYIHTPVAMATVAVIGAATALFAAVLGLAQNDIKKVLAYSTVSQLGYMFLAAGVGAYGAAIFHLMTHAFFKALLFLGAGAVIHSMGGVQDMRKMGGLRSLLPVTFAVMMVATLAISGVPGLSGFFSKDAILWHAFGAAGGPGFSGHPLLWAVGALAAGLTAFYMFRLIFMVFAGKGRRGQGGDEPVHEAPHIMLAPLCVLAVLAVVGGYAAVPASLGGSDRLESYLAPSFPQAHLMVGGGGLEGAVHPDGRTAPAPQRRAEAGSIAGSGGEQVEVAGHGEAEEGAALEYVLMGVSVGIALLGIFLAWLFYVRKPDLPGRFTRAVGPLNALVAGKFYIDEIYAITVLALYYGFCYLSSWFDRRVVDGLVNMVRHATVGTAHVSSFFDKYVVDVLVNAAGWMTKGMYLLSRRVQTGLVQSYAAAMVFGVFVLVGLYLVLGGR